MGSYAHDVPALFHTHMNATVHYNHKLNDILSKPVSEFITKYGREPSRVRVDDGLNRFTLFWKDLKLEKGVCDVALGTYFPTPVYVTESFRASVRIPPSYRNDPVKTQQYLDELKESRRKLEQARKQKQLNKFRDKHQLKDFEVWENFEKILITSWEAKGVTRCSGEYIGGIHF
jgi:hypothetical protein